MCRICALDVDPVLSPSLGISGVRKNVRHGQIFGFDPSPHLSAVTVFSCHWTVKLELVFRSLCVVASERATQPQLSNSISILGIKKLCIAVSST